MVTTAEGEQVYFKHPVFQANSAFVFEFVLLLFVLGPAYYLMKSKPRKLFNHKTAFLEVLPPSALDWADRILLTLGMSQTSASMPTMIRSLVPPLAGYMSYLLFDTSFSVKKVLAMIITVVGVLLGCFVQLYYET